MKKCTKCQVVKSKDQFSKESRAKDSLHCYCKSCRALLRGRKSRATTIQDPNVFKVCSKCKQNLPATSFVADTRARSGLRSSCKACRADGTTLQDRTALQKHTACMNSIKLNYGLSEVDLQNMLFEQQGCCAICKTDFGLQSQSKNRSYCVDHCHTTNKVRSLLCYSCNKQVSLVETGISDKRIYLKYIHKYSTQAV